MNTPSFAFGILAGVAAFQVGVPDTSTTAPIERLVRSAWTVLTAHVTGPGGSVYVLGRTGNPSFPTTADAYDRTCGSDGRCNPGRDSFGNSLPRSDLFLMRFGADGTLEYSTYLGGTLSEAADALAVGEDGVVYIAGWSSPANDFLPDCTADFDKFILRFDIRAGAVRLLRCFHGERGDAFVGVSVRALEHRAGSLYVAGTAGPDQPLVRPVQPVFRGVSDFLVARLRDTDGAPEYITYVGGRGSEHPTDLAVDSTGSVIVIGSTSESDFPLVRPFTRTDGHGAQVAVVKLSPDGQSITFASKFGTAPRPPGLSEMSFTEIARGSGVAVDAEDNIYLVGDTSSSTFPVTSGAFDTVCRDGHCGSGNNPDGFVVKLDRLGALVYSTFIGGDGDAQPTSVTVTPDGCAVVSGSTQSAGFPRFNPLVGAPALGTRARNGAFVLQLSADGSTLMRATGIPLSGLTALRATSVSTAGDASWVSGDFSLPDNGAAPGFFAFRLPTACKQ